MPVSVRLRRGAPTARPPPGPAGAGAALWNPTGALAAQGSRYLGETTNNVAEYQALLLGLELARTHRASNLTLRVYGGDSTTRIMQEILLGVGGVRLLRALGYQPSTFHMNEGHAAFLTLELMRERQPGLQPVLVALVAFFSGLGSIP